MKKKKFFLLLCALLILFGFSINAQTLGDANGSGNISLVDALMIAQYYIGLDPENFHPENADTDCSGSITVVDALLVAQYVVGNITEFPCSTPSPSPSPEPTPTESSTFHIFLLLGQSNMAGYPTAQSSDKVENSRIKVLGFEDCSATGRRTNQWDTACPPLHNCNINGGALGPGDWFAKTLIEVLPPGDTIGLVPCAINGEAIEPFMKGGGRHSWLIQRARLAQQAGGVIAGFIFHQGESNSGQSDWPQKVKTFVQDLREELNTGPVPFIAGELLYSGSCAGHNVYINQLPGIISNCSVVSASGLVVDSNDWQYRLHFGHDSQVELGKRYAAKMIQALGW